ncbi:hypothetical protein IEQ34_000118 [Dendrobium chrysotoxum]|uniref:RING-type domain-containing protein n=1 Tax=Dendrobium chrysotoxum TaxID=161865 RepID=A0AAV7HQG9_DENCH|nr:hypothetical protein IEQ34_000118 [Dendrobium chrysotoxum]
MAPPLSPPQFFNSSSKHQYYYFVIGGMALIVFIVLLVNAFAAGYCAWFSRVFSGQPPPPPMREVQPWIPAYEFRKEEKEEAEVECAVCLSAIADGEMVRELLQCGHTFHVACIDLWFRSHTSCPVCRSIVLPSQSDSMEAQSQEAMLASRMDGNGIITSGIV